MAPLTPKALAALIAKIRTAGGITEAKTVSKDFAEGKAPPIVPKTQAQINAEGLAKAKQSLNFPEKGTPEYDKLQAKMKKDNAIGSEKAGKLSTSISKKTYKK